MGGIETVARRLELSNRLRGVIQSSREQLHNGITRPHEFKHKEPIPHTVVIDKDGAGKPCLVLYLDNTDGEITLLVVETTRIGRQGTQFQEINLANPKNSCQVEIPFTRGLGMIKDVKIQSVIHQGEKLDLFETGEVTKEAN